MAEWLVKSVGQLCDEGLAEIQTGPFGSQLHAYEYAPAGIPVVPTEAIRARRIDYSVLPKIRKEKAHELKRHRLIPGDILFARRGVQATGHTAYVRDEEEGFICGTGAIRLRIKPPFRVVLPEFLSHVFANPASVDWFKFHAIGATMPNLNEGIICSFLLLLPPIVDQQAITSLLSTLDAKIDLNRQMNETLAAMARVIFKDWFIDFGPTHAKAEGRPPYLISDLWSLFPATFDDDKPVSWSEQPLSTFVELISGGTPKTSVMEYWGEPIPWFSVVDTPLSSDVFVIGTEKSITRLGLENSAACLLPLGTTIITARGTVGKLALVGTEMAMNQSCYGVIGQEGWPPYFVHFMLKQAVIELQANTHGSVFDTITRSTFDAVQAINPKQMLAAAFDSVVCSLMERIKANLHENRTLSQLRDLLLPKLMSGEIRLSDAEKLIEERI